MVYTTIRILDTTRDIIKKRRITSRETYDEVLIRLFGGDKNGN
jgi:hypothetical protein